MSRVFLEKDEYGVEYAYFDDATGDLQAVERVQDVEPILEEAKACFNEGLVNRKSEFRRVGSYPPNAIRLFAAKHGIDPDRVVRDLAKDWNLTRLLLNDRDLSGFRTLPGRY